MTNRKKSADAVAICLNCSPLEDFARAKLGDPRRVERLLDIAGALFDAPEASFPEATGGDPAQLEALYRFFNNEHVEPQAILQPHFESTQNRIEGLNCVYAVQDSSDLTFESRDGEHHRQQLKVTGKYTQTLHLHPTLAVSTEGAGIPLGLLGMTTWTGNEEESATRGAGWKKSNRWLEQVTAIRNYIPEGVDVIHVWDREGDHYLNLAQLNERNEHYIIRMLHHNRPIVDDEDKSIDGEIRTVLESKEVLGRRKIRLKARRKNRRSISRLKRYPARKARKATVGVRAGTFRIKRSKNRAKEQRPYLEINVVEVVELNPPKNEEPVSWYLLTSEPIDTEEQMWSIVDGYRARWVIEEFFKCLKTGCNVEKRQLKSRERLDKMLAVMLPLAWRLLLMRDLPRTALAQREASLLFSETELVVLNQAVSAYKLSDEPTLKEACFAMASLGGHLKQSGPPGWLTLWRGFRTLRERHNGFLLGQLHSVEG